MIDMIEKKAYFRRLDYIRVISCILIFLYHLNIIRGGFLAVCTFFTISGYLSCISALKQHEFSLKEYYISRIKKIYIPLLVVVSLTIIFTTMVFDLNWLNLKKETLSVVFGYNNYWQLSASTNYFTKHISSPFTHFWYISMLMQFELLFPLLYIGLRKLEKKFSKDLSTIAICILFITSLTYFYLISGNKDIMPVYYDSFGRSFSFIGGILVALLTCYYGNRVLKKFKYYNKLIFLIYSIALISLCLFVSDKSPNYALYLIITTIISIRLIKYSILKYSKYHSLNFLDFISILSYEIYLVQFPVIYVFQNVEMNQFLKVILIVLITIVLSYIIYVITNYKVKNIVVKISKIVITVLIVLFGLIAYISAKDKALEMQELESKLNDNMKKITENNKRVTEQLEEKKKELQQQEEQKKIEEQKKLEEQKQLEEQKKNEEPEPFIKSDVVSDADIVGIGDSVLLGAIDGLYDKFPNGYFDGKVSRTILDAEELIEDLKSDGTIGNVLVLSLANNGDYRDWICEELMETIGSTIQVYWVTAVGADDPEFNTRFSEFAKAYPNIHIVDWEAASRNHPEYFYEDGIHLKGDGEYAYADLIYKSIYGE